MSKLLLLIGLIVLQFGIADAAKPDKPDRPNIALSQEPFGVQITWTAPSANPEITSYILQRNLGSGWNTISESLSLEYLDTSISIGDEVKYKVRAVNDDGNSKYSTATPNFYVPEIVNEKKTETTSKLTGNPSTNGAPHDRGTKSFQDLDNIRIISSNPVEIVRVMDYGSELFFTLKTVDYTMYITYNGTLLAHVDTGFCEVECPEKPKTFEVLVRK